MVLVDHTGWKLRRRQWTGTTEQLIEQLESTYDNAPNMFSIRIHHGGKFQRYPGRMYVSGRVDIFDMVDIDLFTVVALNMMVLKLGYTGESELMFYNYLRPLTSLDEGLYALACEEDVRCLATLVRSFKLIEVYIEHGVTVLDSYLRAPRFRATLEDITDEPAGSIAANRTEKILLLTWHESSETTKEPVCDSVTPSSLPQHDSSTPCKDSVCESITPRCMPDCILTPPTDESVITYTQLSGVHGVDTQSHVLPTIQSQFSDINLSFVSQQATASQVIDDVISSGLSHDESFGVDDLDLNLNEPVNLNVSQVESQSDLLVSEEPDVGPTQEPILAEVSTQEPIVAEVSTQEPIVAEVSIEALIVEEVGTQEFSVEDVVIEDYVSSGEDGEDAEQGNGQEDESAPTNGQFFYDDEGIDTAYETEYDVQSSEDAGTDDDDDVDEDFLVDEDNEIVKHDVDVYLFGISMDLPFDNIGITNLVSGDVLEGEDVDVVNADSFDSDLGNDEERNYRKRRLAELRMEMEGVINASGQWKYLFYTGQQFTTPKETKDRVYLHFIESRRNLKLYKNDSVKIRARCEGKVPVFTMSQGAGPNIGMEAGPSGSSGPTTRSKKGRIQIFEQVKVNPDIPVKAVQYQLQCELEVQISMSKAFRAKAKAEERLEEITNTDPSLPTRVFQRIYVCLGGLKMGFRACRRDLLGLDGAFIKGPYPGQVLVAVGLYSNNGIYPLTYALVEAETKSSWCWFLQCLGDDIDLHPNSNFTFISDRQKAMNPKAHESLNKIPAEHWARSHFLGRAKSDLLLNNICEVFNGKIVRGRDKAMIILLEYIREYCMKRIVNVQGVIGKCTGPLTLTATRIMESIKKEDHLMKVQWNGTNKYQGIPCKHAVAACWNMALNDRAAPPPETWVNPYYWLSTWKETYSHKIQPIYGTKYWEKSTCPTTLLPPKHHVQVSRPKKKRKRSKHEDEPFVKDGKLNRKGRTITCQSCGNIGHNKATCKGQGRKATTEPAVGQDGSGGSGGGAVKSGAGDPGGAGVASQVPVSQTRNAGGREMGDGVPTQSSAAGGASEWSFL
ncbi:heat stress transcription factor B-4-like protein [Tanacetum coccineum]|uniref:Heat stress transcription factor B-4-like protein n=1 Tax=Tanacetum coccineum TaxID=301880 RepID=A0ABQ5FA62_9ASTR